MKKIELNIICESEKNIPLYATDEAAGADLFAKLEDPFVLHPMQRALISTGVFLEIPKGYEVQIRPRSGLAYREGITVLNTPGTIDSDYRGEIKILLIHLGETPFTIEPGMRIAQMLLAPMVKASFIRKKQLAESMRGSGGFGHTGV